MCISPPSSSVCLDGEMADNSTHPILEILQSFSTKEVVLAFCLSMVVGLLLGALVYVTLTWMSRHRAKATITRVPTPRSSGRPSSPRTHPVFSRHSNTYDRRSNNSLASAAFSFHRQTSSSPDQADLLGRKDSFRASTFHPLLQCSQIAREAEEGNNQNTLAGVSGSTGMNSSAVVTPPKPRPRPDSFWGNCSPTTGQSPRPPAYDSIIRAYQETYT